MTIKNKKACFSNLLSALLLGYGDFLCGIQASPHSSFLLDAKGWLLTFAQALPTHREVFPEKYLLCLCVYTCVHMGVC